MNGFLKTAAIAGMFAATLVFGSPSFAQTTTTSPTGTNSPRAYIGAGGAGSSKDSGVTSHESSDQGKTNSTSPYMGAGGAGSSKDTGVKSHESNGNTTTNK